MGKKAKWKNFSEEEFNNLVKESKSYRDLSSRLGYSVDAGGSITSVKNAIQFYNSDISHFLHQSWNKENYDYRSFEFGSIKSKGKTTLDPIISLRGRKCECCGIENWLDKPINLEIHHKDGNRLNNNLNNLQLLCPNCHSYTETFRGKNILAKRIVSEEDFVHALEIAPSIHWALKKIGLTPVGGNYIRARELIFKYNIEHLIKIKEEKKEKEKEKNYCSCGAIITKGYQKCQDCIHKEQRIVERPDRETLKNLVKIKTFTELGKQYGVSDNSIRKWCDYYNLPRTKKEIKKYSKEEWQNI